MPSWWLDPTITPTPLGTVTPRMPAIKVLVWVPGLPMRMVLASPAAPRAADNDVVTARGEIRTGLKAQGDVAPAGCLIERLNTSSRVGVAGCIEVKRLITVGRVAEAGSVVIQRLKTHCRVEKGSCVVIERFSTVRRVRGASCVVMERGSAGSRVGAAACVE